ncbi:MAG: hypothetical protein H6867_05005 [Rhodospirillales bacterium]|nr:hypothetical protein [Rhodospirillales bacterium]MCB9994887.1 hypothetical protein [Rhodospirillales bacterium]
MRSLNREEIESLDHILLCAKWIVGQFESIHCQSIANIFQKAIDDANAWIHNMVANENLPDQCEKSIHQREAEMIHSILVRYASIGNPEIKQNFLKKMALAIEEQDHNGIG